MLHRQFTAVAEADLADTRHYRLADNTALGWHVRTRAGLPFELRCSGQGECSLGEGVPSYFRTRDDAERVGRTWVLTGVAPADQKAAA